MNDPTRSLQTMLEHAQAERDAAQAALQQLIAQASAAEQQAQQLTAYRADYQRRWSGQFAQGGAIEIVHCYQGFTARLDQAIAQQQRIAHHVQAQVEAARKALAAHELRVASVRKLIERRIKELQRAAERQDQKLTDEAAQRTAWHGTMARMSTQA